MAKVRIVWDDTVTYSVEIETSLTPTEISESWDPSWYEMATNNDNVESLGVTDRCLVKIEQA